MLLNNFSCLILEPNSHCKTWLFSKSKKKPDNKKLCYLQNPDIYCNAKKVQSKKHEPYVSNVYSISAKRNSKNSSSFHSLFTREALSPFGRILWRREQQVRGITLTAPLNF